MKWIYSENYVPFGGTLEPVELLKFTKNIRTFSQEIDNESSEYSAIRQTMRKGTKIVFLGFAFHELNMELIKPKPIGGGRKQVDCFASTFGFSENDEEQIKKQIDELKLGIINLKMKNLKCNDFFNQFSKYLVFK